MLCKKIVTWSMISWHGPHTACTCFLFFIRQMSFCSAWLCKYYLHFRKWMLKRIQLNPIRYSIILDHWSVTENDGTSFFDTNSMRHVLKEAMNSRAFWIKATGTRLWIKLICHKLARITSPTNKLSNYKNQSLKRSLRYSCAPHWLC